MFEYSFLDMQ